MEALLSVREISKLLNLSGTKIYELVAHKRIPHLRLGGTKILFRLSDIQVWLDAQVVPVTAGHEQSAVGGLNIFRSGVSNVHT